MKQESLNEQVQTEFDHYLLNQLTTHKLKEGTIIKGIVAEIEDDAIIVDIVLRLKEEYLREFAFQKDQKKFQLVMK